jgi:hypothetical protein
MRKREEDIPAFNPKAKVKDFQDPRFETRPDRKSGWKWWHLRKQYLMQKPWCERCGLFGEEVHHIIPRHIDPNKIYEWDNLMTLCQFCHMKEHRQGDFKDG